MPHLRACYPLTDVHIAVHNFSHNVSTAVSRIIFSLQLYDYKSLMTADRLTVMATLNIT